MMAYYLQNLLMESVQTVWYRLQICAVLQAALRSSIRTINDRRPSKIPVAYRRKVFSMRKIADRP